MSITQIVDFKNRYVFPGVGVTTCIICFESKKRGISTERIDLKPEFENEPNLAETLANAEAFQRTLQPSNALGAEPWNVVTDQEEKIISLIDCNTVPLSEAFWLGKGMETGCNDVFGERTKAEIDAFELKAGQFFERATNSQIQKFNIEHENKFVIYLERFDDFSQLPAKLQEHLNRNKASLTARAAYLRGDCKWWKFTWPLHEERYGGPKVLCPYLASNNRFAVDSTNCFLGLTDTTVLFPKQTKENLYYFLGLLNADLLTLRFLKLAKLKSAGIYEYFWNRLKLLPIRRVNWDKKDDVSRHNAIAHAAKTIELSYDGLVRVRTDRDKSFFNDKIITLSRELNDSVRAHLGVSAEQWEALGFYNSGGT